MAEAPATIRTLTPKEMKNLAKPEFALTPELYYPTKVFEKFGYTRAQCKCGANYWRHCEQQTTCGDSQCVGSYQFIGRGCGIGEQGQKLTYAGAWETFKRSLTSARVPCTAIARYPVVARWRNDVEYVAAGIYCFQPYCVTGEMPPPANPLICPQFCVRFNDLDNIGLTGRHYSGFIMLGIQVFNLPGKYVFFKEECVEFNLRWLIEELRIDPNRITLIEDVWAGGGNMGPCVEYFIDGLEVGNMVFMQFKTFPDGSREELPVKVVDVGVGLERIPWLVNGTPTSYMDVFHNAFEWLRTKLNIDVNTEIWQRFGPLSCLLNIDEVDDIEATWRHISELIGFPVEDVKNSISPIKDMYIVLDHTRTVLMIIEDGSLPSNVGGGSNVRNILRRVFAVLKKRDWWTVLGMDGLIELFQMHKVDLQGIYGQFKEYKSFRSIIEVEYERWMTTDSEQGAKLQKLLKKNNGKLSMNDWIIAITSWGIPADVISQISKLEVPGNIYYIIAEMQDRLMKAPETILYSTSHLPETVNLYYRDHLMSEFTGTVVDVFPNVTNNGIRNIVILDQSAFYPFSGGQENDTGSMVLDGVQYQVVDVQKVGPAVLHILDQAVPDGDHKGKTVSGTLNMERRNQLRNHHTATHIVFASCRKVLGPHIWQHGAKKTVESAHLDVTHYKSLTHEEEVAIENEANRIISRCVRISKTFMDKAQAERDYGFSLYQGGVVPGNNLRVVNIEGVDTEACCGTHCDNTAEVGWVRILKTTRMSDGIVRLYYVAGEKAVEQLNAEDKVLHTLMSDWKVPLKDVTSTADRFFSGYKRYETRIQKQDIQILDLTVRAIISNPQFTKAYVLTDQENPTLFFSYLPLHAQALKDTGKGVICIGGNFLFGLLGNPGLFDVALLQQLVKTGDKPAEIKTKSKSKGKASKPVDGVCEFAVTAATYNLPALREFLNSQGFSEFQ